MPKRIRRAPNASETPSSSSVKGKPVRSRRAAGPDRRQKTAAKVEPDGCGNAPAFVPEDRAREMVESSLDAVVSLDPAGRVLEFNPAAERLFGYSRAEALGKDLTGLIIPPQLNHANAPGLGGLVSGSESRWLGERVELMARRRDGTQFPIELAMTRLHSCNPPCFTAWFRDISDRRRVEAELHKLRAQRLESMGALPSGLANDLNNILAPILMSVELLQDNTTQTDAARLLETVRGSAQRGADMVRQLLAFTRGHDIEPRHLCAEANTLAPPARTPLGQGQQILLVDDEQAFQEIARSIFVKHGYRVLTANDGAEAVEIFSRHPREIALVMTDMVMPCLDGAATIEALRRIDPGVPILAASGRSEEEMPASAGGRAAFLSKPFTTQTLLQTVAQLLAAPADDGKGRQP